MAGEQEVHAILVKWQLRPKTPAEERSSIDEQFDSAQHALLSGDFDQAEKEFAALQNLVGLGDVRAARGEWAQAETSYQAALQLDPNDIVARAGLAQAWVATGRAGAAVGSLEQILGGRPHDPNARELLASALWSLAGQAHSVTADGTSLLTSRPAVEACTHALRRLRELNPPYWQPVIEQLSTELAARCRWDWWLRPVAGTLLCLLAVLGLTGAVLAGVFGNLPLLITAVAAGAAGLFVVVLVFRQPTWWIQARQAQSRLVYRELTQ